MTNLADSSSRPRSMGAIAALGVIVLATAFLRPGDAPFLNDEPLLIQMARALNHTAGHQYGISLPFTLCPMSMAKTPRGLYYGPAATWLYQILMAITTDPIWLVSLHALILSAMTAAALAWLARTMGVSVWLAVVMMLSPWLWVYHRMLWDNNLCISLSAMAVAAYGDFLATKRAGSLRLGVACAALLPLVHLMTLPLVAALTIHLLIFRRRAIWKFKWSLLAIVVLIHGLAWQYWQYLLVFYEPIGAPGYSSWRGWVFPLLGAQDLAAWSIEELLGGEWSLRFGSVFSYVVAGAQAISCLAYVAVWIGMILAAARTLKMIRTSQIPTTLDHLSTIALGTFLFQCVLDGWQRAYGQPHYFNGTLIAFVIFAWLSVEALYRRYWEKSILVRLAVPLQAAALLLVLTAMSVKIAIDGGTHSLGYGTVLSEQIAATKQLGEYSLDSQNNVTLLFEQWKMFRDALATLQELVLPPDPKPDNRPSGHLVVRYRDSYPGDARIVVENRPL